MKLINLIKQSEYLKTKQELIELASNCNLPPIEVYKVAATIQNIESKRSKYKILSISSSVLFSSLIAILSIPVGSKVAICCIGSSLILIVTYRHKNEISIYQLHKLISKFSENYRCVFKVGK